MLFSKKKKSADEPDFGEIRLFDDEKQEKDVGFYEGTQASEELRRQRRVRAENSGYIGLFNEDNLDLDKPQKSVAKTYGTKYISDGKQIASSIVVDVRSYKKEEKKSKPDLDFEEDTKEESPRRSFFDDLLKELEEKEQTEEKEEEPEELYSPEPPKKKASIKNTTKAPVKKKKKNIDIDIISGDFGGSDII